MSSNTCEECLFQHFWLCNWKLNLMVAIKSIFPDLFGFIRYVIYTVNPNIQTFIRLGNWWLGNLVGVEVFERQPGYPQLYYSFSHCAIAIFLVRAVEGNCQVRTFSQNIFN